MLLIDGKKVAAEIRQQVSLHRPGNHEGAGMLALPELLPGLGRHEVTEPQPEGRDLFGEGTSEGR